MSKLSTFSRIFKQNKYQFISTRSLLLKMGHEEIIVITGAGGFIGSSLIKYLNDRMYYNLILVDNFRVLKNFDNLKSLKYILLLDCYEFFRWHNNIQTHIDLVIHLGARTDTTELDYLIHEELNLNYPKKIWDLCCKNNINLIYASSAATYGAGEFGFDDDNRIIPKLKPLNPYGISKNEFDKWVLRQQKSPPSWIGLKFFNVYGPNESSKKHMASVIWQAINQIKQTGQVTLFKSNNTYYKDGEQKRDFIYIEDVLRVMTWIIERMISQIWPADFNDIYNLGTGRARAFNDIALTLFEFLKMNTNIVFIEMPKQMRTTYQNFTEAKMNKFNGLGYESSFLSLEDGISEYIKKC